MKRRDIIEYAVMVGRQARLSKTVGLGHIVAGLESICKLGKRHYSLALALCNGVVDQEAYDRRIEKVRAKITAEAAALGLKVEFSGDPRGYTVYVKDSDGRGNDWGGRGWGVPIV